MSTPRHIGPEADALLTWQGAVDAIEAGHLLAPAQVDDTLFQRSGDALLSRAAWIDGLGVAVKSATVFPGNGARGLATVNGSVSLFSDSTGELDATLDFHLVTKWKTAADSLLAAQRLARSDSTSVLIVGAGTVAASMVAAYRSAFPAAQIAVWNRTESTARSFAIHHDADVATDLELSVRGADIISTSTMASDPIIDGDWLRPGQHLDLIGGYRPDMREADDRCIARSRLFVDTVATALDVGDVAQPIANSVINADDIVADYSGLATGEFARTNSDDITVFKNAGGAHLDLMVARYIADATV